MFTLMVPLLATMHFVVSTAMYIPSNVYTVPSAIESSFASSTLSSQNVFISTYNQSVHSSAPLLSGTSLVSASFIPPAVQQEHYVGIIPVITSMPSMLSGFTVYRNNVGIKSIQPSDLRNSFASTSALNHQGSLIHIPIPTSSKTSTNYFALPTLNVHTNGRTAVPNFSSLLSGPYQYPHKDVLQSVSFPYLTNSNSLAIKTDHPIDFVPLLHPVTSTASSASTTVRAAHPSETSSASSLFASVRSSSQTVHPKSLLQPVLPHVSTASLLGLGTTTGAAHPPEISSTSSSFASIKSSSQAVHPKYLLQPVLPHVCTASLGSRTITGAPYPSETSSASSLFASVRSSSQTVHPKSLLQPVLPHVSTASSLGSDTTTGAAHPPGISSASSSFASVKSSSQAIHPKSLLQPVLPHVSTASLGSGTTTGAPYPPEISSASSSFALIKSSSHGVHPESLIQPVLLNISTVSSLGSGTAAGAPYPSETLSAVNSFPSVKNSLQTAHPGSLLQPDSSHTIEASLLILGTKTEAPYPPETLTVGANSYSSVENFSQTTHPDLWLQPDSSHSSTVSSATVLSGRILSSSSAIAKSDTLNVHVASPELLHPVPEPTDTASVHAIDSAVSLSGSSASSAAAIPSIGIMSSTVHTENILDSSSNSYASKTLPSQPEHASQHTSSAYLASSGIHGNELQKPVAVYGIPNANLEPQKK